MGYTKINVYGSDACSIRIRAALVLAIQAALDGKHVLLTEQGSSKLRMLLPSKLVFDGDAELFSVTGIEDNRLLIALPRKGELSEEELGKLAFGRQLMICAHAGLNKKEKTNKGNQVLAGGYDGMLLRDTISWSARLPKAFIVAAIPDPLPSKYAKTKEIAKDKLAAFNNGTYEMPLINYTTIALPEEHESDGLWQTSRQLLDQMDYSKQVEAPAPDKNSVSQTSASDGSDEAEITEKQPAPSADLVAQATGDHKTPAQVVEETTSKYGQNHADQVHEFGADQAAADQQREQELAQTQDYWQEEQENRDGIAQVHKENLATRKAKLDEEAQVAAQTSEEVKAQAQALAEQGQKEAKERESRSKAAIEEREKYKTDFAARQAAEQAAEIEKQEKAKQLEEQKRRDEEKRLEEQKRLAEKEELEKQKAAQEKKRLAKQKAKQVAGEPVTPPAPSKHQAVAPAPSTPAKPPEAAGQQDAKAPKEVVSDASQGAADAPAQSEAAALANDKQAATAKAEAGLAKEPTKAEPAKEADKETPAPEAKQEQSKKDVASKPTPPNKRLLEASWATEDLNINPVEYAKQALADLKSIGESVKDAEVSDESTAANKKEAPDKKETLAKKGKITVRKKISSKQIAGHTKQKAETFTSQHKKISISVPVLINTEAMASHVKSKEAAEILVDEHFSIRHPNLPPLPEEDKNKALSEQFKAIFQWYRGLSDTYRKGGAQRQAALMAFKFSQEAKEREDGGMYKIASEFGVNALSDYEKPDLDLLMLWYRHAIWLAHYYIDEKDNKAASGSILSLLETLGETGQAFMEQPDLSDGKAIYTMFLAGLILVAARIEEINPYKLHDKAGNALNSHAEQLLRGLDDKFNNSITEGVSPAEAKGEGNKDTDKHDKGDGDDSGKKKVSSQVSAAHDAFGDM